VKTEHLPFVSVIVATYDRPDYVKRCLVSILANKFEGFEVIVVDQSPQQDTERAIAQLDLHHSRLRYLHSDIVGLSSARNLGVSHARGEILAFIDDDAVATPHWIEAFARVFEEHVPQPGMIGGKIEPLWEVPRPPWYPPEREFLLGIYDIGDEVQLFPPGDLPIGANFAIGKRLLQSVGGFDVRAGFNRRRRHSMLAGEDSLLALKIQEQGLPIYYQPAACVLHTVNASKLRKTYFLKRHFWEGATIVAIRDMQHPHLPMKFLGNIRWHGLRIPYKLYLLLSAMVLPKEKRAREVMLRLAELSLSTGVIYWSGRLLGKGLSKRYTYL
jgi:glycosyltransferase involved in cell wall biosynthesis